MEHRVQVVSEPEVPDWFSKRRKTCKDRLINQERHEVLCYFIFQFDVGVKVSIWPKLTLNILHSHSWLCAYVPASIPKGWDYRHEQLVKKNFGGGGAPELGGLCF